MRRVNKRVLLNTIYRYIQLSAQMLGAVILPAFMVLSGDIRTCWGDNHRAPSQLLMLMNH